jgi:predicted PurR-regulated permease PerM
MRRFALQATTVLATLAGLYFLWLVHHAVLLFVVSLGIAAALRPTINFLTRRGMPRALAMAATYLFAISVPVMLLLMAGQPLVSQMKAVGTDVTDAYKHVEDGWKEGPSWHVAVAKHVPPPEQLYQALAGKSGVSLLSTIIGATFSLFGIVVDLVLTIFLSIYWSIDRVQFERLWLSLLPVRLRTQTRDLWRAVETEAGAYLRSEVIQALSASVVLWGGYFALGQPYPAVLAAIGGLAWLIPWIGVLIAMALLALLSLPAIVLDGGASLWTVTLPASLYTLAVFLILELAIEPRFFNRRRYNALLTAVIAIGMAQIWGLLGLLLGPPVAAIIQIVAWHWVNRSPSVETSEAAGAATFDERLLAIREMLQRVESPSPEALTFVDRMEKLVQEARRLAPQR